jgi:heptosyltransferase I
MERILIVRLGAMGDIIHAIPTVAALRERYPQAEIDWLVETRWVELLAAPGAALSGPRSPQKPLVDNVHLADTKAWRKQILAAETRHSFRRLREQLAARKLTHVFDMQGSLKSAVLARCAHAERVIGYRSPREKLAAFFYNKHVDVGGHVIERGALLLGFSGKLSGMGAYESFANYAKRSLPTDAPAEHWATSMISGSFALLSPTAGWAAKEWPPERYGAIARELVGIGIQPLVNIGPGERESRVADKVERASGGVAKRVSCSISQLVALTRRASLFVGGDSGPMHLANALGVPTVAIFGPTDPARNGPYYNPNVVLRSSLSKTSYSHVDTPDPGTQSITVEQVWGAAQLMLKARA